ncbi:HNH endonuclease signature motif containing protein [uncultured Aliiroseovarius sp.]|uniref:HNH endonuclease n=1 Tax=uncultured Aliiroseovarius sp. TaxID=1658783 RepID=UPI002591B307|nr:HNH endonuclease signature motif containing protein [uncultured Aliiroseovarius sp.]
MKGNPTRLEIKSAMAWIEDNGLPDGFRAPHFYHLVHPETGRIYPPKAVWGLATGFTAYDFDATSAKRWLENLGFYVHDSRLEPDSDVLQNAISVSRDGSPEARQARLRNAPTVAKETLVLVQRFERNPDVVAERLHIADGVCDQCASPAPFRRAKDGQPYLEVHHVLPLADGGEDTVENTRALCPNCHRKAHFG